MKFHFSIEQDKIQLNYSQWTMRKKVLLNGSPVQRNGLGRPFELKLSNGTVKQMYVKNMFFSFAPQAIIEGKNVLPKNVKWFDYVLVYANLLLLLVTGLYSILFEMPLGGIAAGALRGFLNGLVWGVVYAIPYGLSIELLQKKPSLLVKIFIITGMTLVSILISLLLSYIFKMGFFINR